MTERLFQNVEPEWGAAIFFVGHLYGVWAVRSLFGSLTGGADNGGYGAFAIYILALPVWVIAVALFQLGLMILFVRLQNPLQRAGCLAVALLGLLIGSGVPGLYQLLIGAALAGYGYYGEKKKRADENDLADFE